MKDWIPVSKDQPCSICKKPDWCLIGQKFILCNRVQSKMPQKGGGWLHPINCQLKLTKPVPSLSTRVDTISINPSKLMREWAAETSQSAIDDLAESLGVSPEALNALGAAWAPPHRAWAFPMKDGYGEMVGIRLRDETGKKWAVRGSKQGIFIPDTQAQQTAYVCEGPTDTAAALSLGLYAIGRPSCNCGGNEIKTACKRLGVSKAVIVADNDAPGQQGALKVAGELRLPTAIYTPPAKDLREFVRNGGSRLLIEQQLKNTVWRKTY
jgi:hypothetical protein